MLAKRIIPCLDVKDGRVVKGVNFVNLRDAGDPVENAAAYDGEGNELKSLKSFTMPFGEGVIGMVAQTGIPHIVNNTQADPGWSPIVDRLTGFTTKKLIAVPLIAEGEIVGVMELLNKKEGDFGQRDIELLSLVASSAAIAIKNARQYAAIKKANEALREVQEQRIAAERWAVLGKAAGNLAHRINNSTALVPVATQHLAGWPSCPLLQPRRVRRHQRPSLQREF